MLFVSSAALVGCASVEIPDIKPHVELPGSEGAFWVSTTTEAEGEYTKEQWEWKKRNKAHIILFSDDWKILRFSIVKNCLSMTCKNAVGTLDFLMDIAEKQAAKANELRKSKK